MRNGKSASDLMVAQLPRRDILAICVYLNRNHGPKSVDACVSRPEYFIDRLAAAARMQ
jgi:hypothetical protein